MSSSIRSDILWTISNRPSNGHIGANKFLKAYHAAARSATAPEPLYSTLNVEKIVNITKIYVANVGRGCQKITY
jgi:hypothetical protein